MADAAEASESLDIKGVRRAFLWLSIRSIHSSLIASAQSACPVLTEWTAS
jgi:hypothetical protein